MVEFEMAERDELGWSKYCRRGEVGMQNYRARRMWSKRVVKHRWLWMQAILLVLVVAGSGLVVQGQDLGTWEIVVENAGIASMHAAVTNYGTVVLLDRTNTGATQIALPSTHSNSPTKSFASYGVVSLPFYCILQCFYQMCRHSLPEIANQVAYSWIAGSG